MKKLAVIILLVSAAAHTQSLADAARKARADKVGDKKATRVYDNDSMARGSTGGVSSVGKDEVPTVTKPSGKKEPSKQDQEKMYRMRFTQLRGQLKAAEAKAAQLQAEMQKASPNTVAVDHYYHDPKYIASLQTSIAANDKAREQLKKQIADLEEEIHSKGLPASWADPN